MLCERGQPRRVNCDKGARVLTTWPALPPPLRTKDEAQTALTEALPAAGHGELAHDGGQRVGDHLDRWLAEKVETGLRVTTARSYREHVTRYIKPSIGHLELRDLTSSHVQAMLLAIGRPVDGHEISPATVRRVHATLRSALSTAKRRHLVKHNAAVDADLPTPPTTEGPPVGGRGARQVPRPRRV